MPLSVTEQHAESDYVTAEGLHHSDLGRHFFWSHSQICLTSNGVYIIIITVYRFLVHME